MGAINLDLARHNMVVQQIQPCDVSSDQVLGLLETVARHAFVPTDYSNIAYVDAKIPLGHDQVMMPPLIEAQMMQALNIQPDETVLEVGTGSGFMTALLAKSARHVHSIEIIPELSEQAQQHLNDQRIYNVSLEVGDAVNGWSAHAPYDVIAITGSLPILNESMQQSLKTGGRLFVITGEAPVMEAVLITRISDSEWCYQSLFETDIPALQNAPCPEHFSL